MPRSARALSPLFQSAPAPMRAGDMEFLSVPEFVIMFQSAPAPMRAGD